jgi:hypothetical protein
LSKKTHYADTNLEFQKNRRKFMKKAGILIVALILVAAMFSGCRRGTTDTTGTTAPTTTTTAKPTTPKTTGTTKPSSGVIPNPGDMIPEPSGTTAPGRNHRSDIR